MSPLLTERLTELQAKRDDVGRQLTREQIVPTAARFIAEVQPLLAGIEQFTMQAAEDDWTDGVEAALEIAGQLISLGEKQSGFRFVAGLPNYLAFRLLLVTGAAAVDAEAFGAIRTLLRTPIEVELLGRQFSHKTLPQHRDLFFPETFLGYADYPIRYLSDIWDASLAQVFGDQHQFRQSLEWFLILIALAADDAEDDPMYPGYRLLEGAETAAKRFASRLLHNDGFASRIARLFDETVVTFRQKWPERVRRLNAAPLGGNYFPTHNFLPSIVEE